MTTGTIAQHVTAVTRRYRWYVLVGALLLIVGLCFEGFGVISGFMAVWFGACCGMFAGRQSERGVWMLSVLFLAMTAVFGAFAGYGMASDLIAHRVGIATVLGAGIAAALLVMQVLLLATVTYLSLSFRPPAHGGNA